MVIGPAYSRLPFFEDNGQSVLGSSLRETAKESISDWLASDGHRLVGQEVVTLSTTPAYIDNKLVPRPMSLRVLPPAPVMAGRSCRAALRGSAAATMYPPSPCNQAAVPRMSGSSATSRWNALRFYRRKKASPATCRVACRAVRRTISSGSAAISNVQAHCASCARHGRYARSADPRQPLLAHVTRYLEALDVEMNDAVPESLLNNINSALYSASNIRDRFRRTDGLR